MTLLDFAEYLRDQHLSAASVSQYTSAVRALALPDDVDEPSFVTAVSAKMSPTMPVGTRTVLAAAARRYAAFRQWAEPSLPRARAKQHAFRYAMTADELRIWQQLVDSQVENPAVRTVLSLLPLTVMRVTETCALRWEHVVWPAKKAALGELSFVAKGGALESVPLTPRAVELLRAWHRTQHEPNVGYVFPARGATSAHMTRHVVEKVCRRLSEHPDAPQAVTPHVLRHTGATLLLEAGVDLRTVQALLRHTSIKTTTRYLHPSDRHKGSALSKMDDLVK